MRSPLSVLQHSTYSHSTQSRAINQLLTNEDDLSQVLCSFAGCRQIASQGSQRVKSQTEKRQLYQLGSQLVLQGYLIIVECPSFVHIAQSSQVVWVQGWGSSPDNLCKGTQAHRTPKATGVSEAHKLDVQQLSLETGTLLPHATSFIH